jgi:hypothetical protein
MSLTPRTAGKLMLYPRPNFQIGREAHANVGSCRGFVAPHHHHTFHSANIFGSGLVVYSGISFEFVHG